MPGTQAPSYYGFAIHSTWLPPHGPIRPLELQPSLQHPSQQEEGMEETDSPLLLKETFQEFHTTLLLIS